MTATEYKGYVGPKFENMIKQLDTYPTLRVMVNDSDEGIVDMLADSVMVADCLKLCNIVHVKSYYDKAKTKPYTYITLESDNPKWVSKKEIIKKELALVLFG